MIKPKFSMVPELLMVPVLVTFNFIPEETINASPVLIAITPLI